MVVQAVAPPLRGAALSAQRWANLTFLHWPVEPDAVQRFMPAGVRPDVIDGVTYVALVPFQMRGAGPGGRLRVPYFGDFCETNVRLYSVDDEGRSGIVFRTLESDRLSTTLLARWGLGLPYTWSKMRAVHAGDLWRYTSARRWPRTGRHPLRSELTVRVGDPVEPTPLEVWLTARWGLHTRLAGRTVWIPNEHGAWPLHSADILGLDDDLVAGTGIPVTGEMLRPLFSPGVRTTFGLPIVVSR
ncbi:uncharacterized protein YqjF (DUF2071 family) [Nakamurella sp. UYEF19]|uniref:YqjF family protein n=1 Tax=Nakamurella sp. UYEF19 TaxID=1756392 RepID=UPI003395657A